MLGGEISRKVDSGQITEAEEAVQWYKRVFGDDYYLELQRHKQIVLMPIRQPSQNRRGSMKS